LLVGLALQTRDPSLAIQTWAKGSSAPAKVIEAERSLEAKVSSVIAGMHVVWLPIDDEPGPASLRGFIERNSIALLSGYASSEIDPPSAEWLGRYCSRERIRTSGLWNSNHVHEAVDSNFLDFFERLINDGAIAPSPSFSAPKTLAGTDEDERIPDNLRRHSNPDDVVSRRGDVGTQPEVNIGDVTSKPHGHRRNLARRAASRLGKSARGGSSSGSRGRRAR
jgi:hypothetical protein